MSELLKAILCVWTLNAGRYTTFYILYPTGMSSEAGLIFIALPFMQVRHYFVHLFITVVWIEMHHAGCYFERRLLLFFESVSNLKIKNASAVVRFWLIILMGLLGQESGLYSLRMPNKLNFGFDYYYASILGLISYLPGKLPISAIFHETAF